MMSEPSAHVLTEDQLHLREAAREFALKEVLPVANELDPIGGVIPQDLLDKMAEIGFFGVMLPERSGGLGLGVLEYALITEELSRAWMSVGSIIRASTLPRALPAERRAILEPLAAQGKYLGAFSLSEAEAGSDVANIRTRAVRDGDDWIINGAKMWCTFADQADYIVLFARTSPTPNERRRHLGISAFMIEKERGSFPAGIRAAPVRKIGYHGWNTFELGLSDVRVPGSALLGNEGEGFYAGMVSLDIARIHTAARAVGVARGALEDAVTYARERVQFGEPIASFQGLRFKMAHMAAEIEAARALTHHTARLLDAGLPCSDEAAMAKYVASEMAEKVTSDGLQVHGGAGYTTDFAAQRYWRDARLTKIFEGTSEIQLRIISDRLLGKVAR
ncbi:acyl-CoA dehydrogenase [Actinomycetospora sp. NBRC 106375]|uniref:acyl-CoA dehydrogenase family protein n=1 Tax=Actinomycetospora sp. NBRC 106375 TaxID=3032207 RepID=UPI0024A36442|nr:acyl-CoA dehydrogenase family protein [Actinomycetospora sp. NBRC 106375]GLZ49868.1 acyl-CoA dehydrogenase [Actinomycetospora sp. NBRC 106375]